MFFLLFYFYLKWTMGLTMSLINKTNHLYKKNKYVFIKFW